MSYFKPRPAKLEPCKLAGEAAELFVVEGDSAASAVSGIRNPHFQAVLALQGKPLNAWRGNAQQVAAFDGYRALAETLGTALHDSRQDSRHESAPLARQSEAAGLTGRYGRVLLLFDPDADGIHCGALTLIFFYRWLRTWYDAGRIEMVRAPLFELQPVDRDGVLGEPVHAWTDSQQLRLQDELRAGGAARVMLRRHRGLGAIDPAFLAASCIDPKTRRSAVMGEADARAVLEVFGWNADGGTARHE